jgi:hypothetical protein
MPLAACDQELTRRLAWPFRSYMTWQCAAKGEFACEVALLSTKVSSDHKVSSDSPADRLSACIRARSAMARRVLLRKYMKTTTEEMTETRFFASLAELCMAEERRAPVVSEHTALSVAVLAIAARSLTHQMARYFPTKMP